jgi:hypothetical protein
MFENESVKEGEEGVGFNRTDKSGPIRAVRV